jgi:hypothetical protein
VRLPVRGCLVALGLIAVSVGCAQSDPGPTAAQAGETLKSHITWLVKHSGPFPKSEVTDPGDKEISCAEDKVKRTYGVTVTLQGKDSGLIDQMTGALGMNLGYKVDKVFAPDSYRTILKLEEASTVITLDMPEARLVTVVGETGCLPKEGR